MKQIILLFLIIPLCNSVFAQYIENPDFSDNHGNDLANCPNVENSGYQYIISGLTNWTVSHGTPNFPTPNETTLPQNSIFIADDGGVGEGFVGGYDFQQGYSYTIRIEVYSGSNMAAGIHVLLGKGTRPYNENCTEIPCKESNYNGTYPNNFDRDHIQELAVPLNVGLNCFNFNSDDNYNWIWIYARDFTACSNIINVSATNARIVYVYITKKCKESLTLPGLFIPPGSSYDYRNIYAGSVYGSSTQAIVLPTITTAFEATQSITLSHNFIANQSAGFFLATINPNSCDLNPPNTDFAPCENPLDRKVNKGSLDDDDFRKGMPNDSAVTTGIKKNQLKSAKEITIYPNPNTGSFAIEAPRGDYDIQIVNLLGVVVQQETIENDTKKNIVLKQELAAGNYMVNIKGNGYTEIKRITIIK